MERDYCTLSPEGTWAECCKLHDRRYSNNRISRYQADKLLYRCIKRKADAFVASIYFIGVRLFGWYYYQNKEP